MINNYDPNTPLQTIHINSVYGYYYTLPKEVREHIIVRNAARMIELTKHSWDIQKKQIMLNYAA